MPISVPCHDRGEPHVIQSADDIRSIEAHEATSGSECTRPVRISAADAFDALPERPRSRLS